MANEPSFVASIREHGPSMGRVCMALLGSLSEAEQALEQTVIAAKGEPFPAPEQVAPWLFGIARKVCAERLLGIKAPLGEGKEPEKEAPAAAGALEEAATQRDGAAASTRAREALAQLKPTEREAVVLHFVGGLSFADVARACGTDEATTRGRIERGVAQLCRDTAATGGEEP